MSLPSLYERAEMWHRRHLARCRCASTVGYPCIVCQREIGDLLDLLDEVASDAILSTVRSTLRTMQGHEP
jgi:hypothetical protein